MSSPNLSKSHAMLLIFVSVILFSLFIAPTLLEIIRDSHSQRSSNWTMLQRAASRPGRSLIYWTPHKTGSTSMRLWLRTIAKEVGVPCRSGGYYPYMRYMDWHTRTATLSNETCNFIMGHMRIKSVQNRQHEGSLGAVITTTRNAMDTLASKHFHRTSNDLETDLKRLLDKSSRKARTWFFYFNDLDPCEQLRYYDGKEGCEEDEELLVLRARSIAERIDCAVDTDDPEEDLNALCQMMRVKSCEPFPSANVGGHSLYKELFEKEHVTRVMHRVLRVTEILRAELMKRRCRFLTDGSGLSTPGLEEPKWPFTGCKYVS